MNEEQRQLALEEVKLLSSIIGRIESTIYQRQVWLFTLITGLALALFKDGPLICRQQFLYLSVSVTIVFWIADAIQRVPVHRAIERSKVVEKSLREGKYKESPLITDSLGNGKSCKDFVRTLFRFRVMAPYLATLAVIGIIWLIAP